MKSMIKLLSAALIAVLGTIPAMSQIAAEAERNTSKKTNYQNECAIKVNPTNKNQVVTACNNALGGLFFARSTDRGSTWTYPDADKTIADGDAGQGNLACCDPNLAWDTFGNLYVTYLGNAGAIETLISTDAGLTFTQLATFAGSNDQPSVVAENTTDPAAPVALWIVWNNGAGMRARGAPVTGLNTVGAFTATQVIPGTNNCSFGDVAVSPAGVVVQTCQSPVPTEGPSNILINIDADGLGAGNFGAAIVATATNVGGFDEIPAQAVRTVDSEAGLAFDRNNDPMNPSPHFGRLYLVYTDETVAENDDTDILVRFSDDNGATWSASVQVNDDVTVNSQFNPKISSNPISGNIGVCWHDARNAGASNDEVQIFCSLATPSGASPTFLANGLVSSGTSQGTGSNPPEPGQADIQYGDYAGLDYFQGRMHPVWADQSDSLGDSPDGATHWEAYTNRVGGGVAANEGDPHLRTVDGTHYDFQTAGEFTALRAADGLEVQTRQRAVSTTFFPGPNPHTGLASCVSLNAAVAVRVGDHRVSYQPPLHGQPSPEGLELRIDGEVRALTPSGITLSGGGRVLRSGVGGMEVHFPSGARLVVTPGWWASQGYWYLNVNTYGADAYEGIMGAISAGGWLPALPDGTSMGPKPGPLAQRYADLNVKFANAWRVKNSTSLFDYAPGTSTDTFTLKGWPKDRPPCIVPEQKPVDPAPLEVAKAACQVVRDKIRRENCIFDVVATGERGFARTFELTEKMENWATVTDLSVAPKPVDGALLFLVAVENMFVQTKVPAGMVQFLLNGERHGDPVKLDVGGQAQWLAKDVDPRKYAVTAQYLPEAGTLHLGSTSAEITTQQRR